MAGYWPSSFFAYLCTETKSRSIKTQKEKTTTRPICSHLDRTSLVNKEGGKGGVPITHHVEFLNEITYHGEHF